jgi:hypothetical protein
MQKVEGSSPFIRLQRSPAQAGLLVVEGEGPGDFSRNFLPTTDLSEALVRARVAEIEGVPKTGSIRGCALGASWRLELRTQRLNVSRSRLQPS